MKIPLLASIAGLFLLAGCEFGDFVDGARFKQDFHYTYDVQPGSRLSVETQNGSIEIASWDQNTVQVEGTKFASSKGLLDSISIDSHGSPDSVALRAIVPPGFHGNAGASFTIKVPRKVTLERIVSSNATISVDGIEGEARLHTSNGAIHATMIRGPVEARTSNASIEVEDQRGDVDAHSSNGHIRVESTGGKLRAETSNSSIEATLKDPTPTEPVKLDSSNGHITLTLEAAKLPEVKADTNNSSIELRLPSNAGLRLHASTSNSSISNDFEITLSPGTQSKHRLEGTIGGGGPDMTLSTSNGSIKIVKGI